MNLLRRTYEALKNRGKFTGEVIGFRQRYSEGRDSLVNQEEVIFLGYNCSDGKVGMPIERVTVLGVFDVSLRNDKGETKTFDTGVTHRPKIGEKRKYNLRNEVSTEELERRVLADFGF